LSELTNVIGRILLYTIIALLGVFVLGSTFALEHGGGYTSARPAISVHDLRLLPESYKGKTVTTEGDLHYSPDLGQYEVVDADQQAVVVLGYEETALQGMVGKTVIVTGRFDFDEEHGIFIDIDSIGIAAQ
jgi:hypothetical protein